jgi:hypothetical protein
MPQTPGKKTKSAPLSPKAAAKKQERINKALAKYTEKAAYPEIMYQRTLKDLKMAAGSIYLLDIMIADLNKLLHQAQGARTGKISIRFTKDGSSLERDRSPRPIVWFGGDGPTIYKRVDERLTRVKMHGLTINRRPVRKLLNQIQILLDKRAALVGSLTNFSQTMKQYSPGITSARVATNNLMEEIPKMLEVDFTKVQ